MKLTDLLRLLNVVAQHFAAASLSLRLTKSFDAVRILVMACIATIADSVMRVVACDVSSQLSLHYAGKADGPRDSVRGSGGFGIEMRVFQAESSTFLLSDPSLVLARTQVLDYLKINESMSKTIAFFSMGKKHVSRFRGKRAWTESLWKWDTHAAMLGNT